MLDGAFALLERSLRIDLRSRSAHLMRLALLVAIYLALLSALATEMAFGAPGLRFFESIAYLDWAFVTLIGIGFFSAVITEEKEEDTLGLMLMAGVSPLGILSGKSLGGLWQAILLIVVQYPFILLAVTLGGVTSGQIFAVTISLVAYIVLLAGFGLLCSTLSSNSRNAAWMMGAGMVAYIVAAYLAESLSMSWIRSGLTGAPSGHFFNLIWMLVWVLSDSCLLNHLDTILSTGFSESALSVQVVSNLAAGAVFAGLSWLMFGIASRSPSTESNSRGLLAHRRGFFHFGTGQVWSDPFLWKDFQFVSGGIAMMLVRVMYFGALGLIPFLCEYFFSFGGAMWYSIIAILFSASITAANVVARSMYDEIRGQTLPSLLMLPRSSTRIVYSKLEGALLGWLPGPLLGPVTLLTSDEIWQGIDYMTTSSNWPSEPEDLFMITLGLSLYGMFFVLIPHFAAVLATYLRWGAVPLAIGLAIGVFFALITVIMTLEVNGGGSGVNEYVLFPMMLFVLSFLCVACHIVILLRVQALAAK